MGKGIQFTHDCTVYVDDYALPLGSFNIVLLQVMFKSVMSAVVADMYL